MVTTRPKIPGKPMLRQTPPLAWHSAWVAGSGFTGLAAAVAQKRNASTVQKQVAIFIDAYPDELKTSLRHLAAARYFLPVVLSTPAEWEEQYIEYLHHTEFELALDSLEGIGESHSGYAEEHLFWQELLFAAENMELLEHAARYKEHLSKLDVL